jgi:hypothetical protein
MRDFIHGIATNRAVYMTLVLLNVPGFAAYVAAYNGLPVPSVSHSALATVYGVVVLTLDALVILTYLLHGVLSFVEYLTER